jgi:DNA-binding NtrC family response regulator
MTKLIAIIDDEPEMEFIYPLIFSDQLKNQRLKLIFFSDIRRFLEWSKDQRPDMILSDINMPYMSGLELVQQIRKTGQSIPIYFISGDDESDHSSAIAKLGACRYLTKPLNLQKLVSAVEEDLSLLQA